MQKQICFTAILAIYWHFDNYPMLFFSFLSMFGAAGGVNIRWVGLRFPPRVYAVPGELLVKIAPRAGPGQGYEGHKSSLLQLLTIPPSSPAHFGTTNNQSHITNLKYQTTMEIFAVSSK